MMCFVMLLNVMYVTCLDAKFDPQVSVAGSGKGFWSSSVFCSFSLPILSSYLGLV